MHIELFNGNRLHDGLGISEERKERIHLQAEACHSRPGAISEQMARLAAHCETPNELVYAIFHYCFLRSCASAKRQEGPAGLPKGLRKLIEGLLRDVEDEDPEAARRHDDIRRELWREGLMTCECSRCERIRDEMENLHPKLAAQRRRKPRPDLN